MYYDNTPRCPHCHKKRTRSRTVSFHVVLDQTSVWLYPYVLCTECEEAMCRMSKLERDKAFSELGRCLVKDPDRYSSVWIYPEGDLASWLYEYCKP